MASQDITPRRHIQSGIIILIAAILLMSAVIGTTRAVLPKKGRIAAGVTVQSANIGGLTADAARERLRVVMSQALIGTVTLTAGSHALRCTMDDLGATPDVEATLQAAFAIGREQAFLDRCLSAWRARHVGTPITPTFTVQRSDIIRQLRTFGACINHQPQDATARWDDQSARVVIVPEAYGEKLDVPASTRIIEQTLTYALKQGSIPRKPIKLVYRFKYPAVTADDLNQIDTVLATYSTSYATSAEGRASNVETAARAIDGTLLMPDEVFSFNRRVGPRDHASGFREAPVIINGQLKPGMGGGICQVSTTLYNAVLLANLEIVSRSHHSLPVHYAPLGQDATVAENAIDFRFRNSSPAPILLETHSANRRLTVRVIGKGPVPHVRIERSGVTPLPGKVVTREDATLPKGMRLVEQKGTCGYAVTVTRVVGDGDTAQREVISNDRYTGEPRIIRLGTSTTAASSATTSMIMPPTTP